MKFTLTTPIKVQVKRDGINTFEDISELFFKAPEVKDRDLTIILKKKFFEAVINLAKNDMFQNSNVEQKKDDEMKASAIKLILYMSKDFDIYGYIKKFSELMTRVCYKEEDLTNRILLLEIEKINEEDLENILCQYLEFFFVNSWMKTLNMTN